MAKIKGVFKTFKSTPNGRRYYHYVVKGGPQFWIGGRDDDDETPGYREAYEVAAGTREKPAPTSLPGHEAVVDMERAWKSSREWKKKLVRPGIRFNDLRGSKATELVWTPGASIGDIALQMGWSQETAARMIGVYASLNPNALKAPTESETPNSAPN